MTTPEIRVGFVGVNTWHAEAFTDVFLQAGPASHVPPIPGARVTAVWGEPETTRDSLAARLGARVYHGDVTELIGQVDLAIILDDTDGGARHRELATPFILAGVPTLIDKPMTLDVGDAVELFGLASAQGTPIMSSSALRFAVELEESATLFKGLGELRTVAVLGPGEWYYYGIHAVELLLTIMPAPVAWVQRFAEPTQDIAIVGFADGRMATIDVLREAYYTFTATAYGTEGWHQIEVVNNYGFYQQLLLAGVTMAQTGVAPVRSEATLDVLRVLQAGIRSAELGRAVTIAELNA